MPKQIYNIRDFSGGINGKDSPRNVKENEVIEAKSISFDEIGRMRMLGNFGSSGIMVLNSTTASGSYDGDLPTGYGLLLSAMIMIWVRLHLLIQTLL